MVKIAEKKRKKSSLLPAMGLVLAVSLGVICYFLAPMILDFAVDQSPKLEQRVGYDGSTVDTPFGVLEKRLVFEVTIGVLMWFIVFAVIMMVVAASLGEDPAYEERLIKPRRDASDKEWEKYQKKYKKVEERRMKAAEEKQRREERERRR